MKNHASDIWACDFTTVNDWLFRTRYIFVLLELKTAGLSMLPLQLLQRMNGLLSSCVKQLPGVKARNISCTIVTANMDRTFLQ